MTLAKRATMKGIRSIQAENKRRMEARLEALRRGDTYVKQTPMKRLRPGILAGLAKLRADRMEGVSSKVRRPRQTGPDAHCCHLRDRLNPPEGGGIGDDG